MTTATTATPTATAAADRKAERLAALELAREVLADEARTVTSATDALETMVTAFSPKTKPAGTPRELLTKADPAVVGAYFQSTGLTRKQLAGAAGVSTSVIATVQNTNRKPDGTFVGDQWSEITFAVKRGMIDTYLADHADELEAARQADLAEAAAKQAAIDAKAQRVAARAAVKAAPTAPVAPATAPAAKAAGRKAKNTQVAVAAAP